MAEGRRKTGDDLIRQVFHGPNAGYVQELYEQYRRDPESVEAETRSFFRQVSQADAAPSGNEPYPSAFTTAEEVKRIVAAGRIARNIREYGHLEARFNPLSDTAARSVMDDPNIRGITPDDLARLPANVVWADAGPEAGSCLDALERLRTIYSGPLAYDFSHVHHFEERDWLQQRVESGSLMEGFSASERRALLNRLVEVERFEHFLHSTFTGQKRFSIEGTDALVPMLDEIIHMEAKAGAREVLVGMAHRGRLNVLAHVLGKPYAKIFSEFHTAVNKDMVPSEGSTGINYGWTGDVKYHLGRDTTVTEPEMVPVRVILAHNPSHLEFVNPVIEGYTRASQEDRSRAGSPRQNVNEALAVLIHGDAAFPGEGVVAETLNLSRLAGYQTGGTVHIIVNNQLGFTTGQEEGRSTLYASDLAKGFEIPIVHVNADDPEACLVAVRLACLYRNTFHRDFLVDLVGYRRWGHNEGDEPAFTQPTMYREIANHLPVREIYARRLIADGVVTADEVAEMATAAEARLSRAKQDLMEGRVVEDSPSAQGGNDARPTRQTGVAAERLEAINRDLLTRPEGFSEHPKLRRLLERRREAIHKPGGIDWGLAEALAFGTILTDGTPIRLTGQDSERGTFSQRHLVLHDVNTGQKYTPLQHVEGARASFAVYNSPLSEAGVLGFEYGYSVRAPRTLVLWEAQFGDFANAAQVLIDQFIAPGWAKWRQHSGLVLLLPHGYEGQGPEHSSARLERYLQLAADNNLRIANCTTAAQYFHLLREQAGLLEHGPRPLVIMTPKSLLRHPLAACSLGDLADGRFQPVMVAPTPPADTVTRLVFCSGKVAVDLTAANPPPGVGIVRLEQLYPFPEGAVRNVLNAYPNLGEVIWLQEEPRNMGAWSFVSPRLREVLPSAMELRYIGRPERASTAEGSAESHAMEQARIVGAAFSRVPTLKVATGRTK